jgi:hypothetical protein
MENIAKMSTDELVKGIAAFQHELLSRKVAAAKKVSLGDTIVYDGGKTGVVDKISQTHMYLKIDGRKSVKRISHEMFERVKTAK